MDGTIKGCKRASSSSSFLRNLVLLGNKHSIRVLNPAQMAELSAFIKSLFHLMLLKCFSWRWKHSSACLPEWLKAEIRGLVCPYMAEGVCDQPPEKSLHYMERRGNACPPPCPQPCIDEPGSVWWVQTVDRVQEGYIFLMCWWSLCLLSVDPDHEDLCDASCWGPPAWWGKWCLSCVLLFPSLHEF